VMLGGVFLEVFCRYVYFVVSLFFIPCGWSCSTLWMYLLLGVDVVWHCFCSPCCDLCAAAWVTVLYTMFLNV